MHREHELLGMALSRRAVVLLGLAAVAPVVTPRAGAAQEQDAVALLQQAAATMGDMTSFHFAMSTPRGKSLIMDQLELSGFEGDVQRPDRFRVEFTAKAAILALTIKVIGIGNQLWVTDPMSREENWIEVTGGDTGEFALPEILNPDRLLQSAVELIQEPKITGTEEIDGAQTTLVEGTFDPRQANQRVTELTGTPVPELSALTGDAPIPVRIWIDEGNRVRRVEFDGPLTAADQGDVIRQFDLTKIDEPVDIQPPA